MSLVALQRGSRAELGIGDTFAMAGRNIHRLLRAPDQVVFTLVSPILFTLLFRYVFGGAIRGLGSINYVNYLIPGIAVQTAIFTSSNSGFALADDRGNGFLDRLRSLPMARSAVLIGRVLTDTVSNATGLVIIVIVGLAVGFRPHSVPGLVVGFGVLLAFVLATSFLFALVGLYASSSQAVNAATFPVIFPLTFASSAFVPTATMPSWLQGFAKNQPLSVTVSAVRALLEGGPAAHWVWQSLTWSAGIFLVFFAIALRLYRTSTS